VVAGISRGTLVTEAAEKSGTLITAGLALDFGREVFALPGDITKTTSTGTNRMIRDGEAKLVIEATDILCEYETVSIRENKIDPVIIHTCNDPVEKSLYELLMKGSYNISDMEDILGLDIAIISFKLSMMEVRGIIHMGMDGSYNIK
jgi:DNA processing protein